MEAIILCRLDTPIIFIEARINLSRFVVTCCAAKTSATVTFFFFYRYGVHRYLHSFPTRRSSDLESRSEPDGFLCRSSPRSLPHRTAASPIRACVCGADQCRLDAAHLLADRFDGSRFPARSCSDDAYRLTHTEVSRWCNGNQLLSPAGGASARAAGRG